MGVFRNKIGHRLVIIFVCFVTAVVGGSGWFVYRLMSRSLEDDLGEKLMTIAQATATQISPELLTKLGPGDEATRTYANLANRLKRMRDATGARRLYIFDRESRSLVDSDGDVPIGRHYAKLAFDKPELEAVWQGTPAHSVLFKGKDERFYKSGYAPIFVGDNVVAAVGVDASAAFLTTIQRFRRTVILFILVSICVTVAIGVLFSKTITGPINRLVKAAQRIGQGDFEEEVAVGSKDELGYLANTLDEMRKNIIKRDHRLKMMLAGIAHEIRNPLGGIELFAGLVADRLEPRSEEREHTGRVITEVRNLNQIITGFLDFARPKEPVKESVPLDALIEDSWFLLAHELEDRRIVFKKELTQEDLIVFVDPEQMRRALLNVFKNAVQAMEDGGELSLRCEKKQGGVQVRISDTGVGVREEDLDKLFDPFFSTKEQGVGLGLSIVKKIVEDNGGRIWVESREGHGTTFALLLPEIEKD